MTSAQHAEHTGPIGQPAGAGYPDVVVAAMGGLGHPVDTSTRSLPLEGPHVLWLVVHGALDLFAVHAAGAGRWHYLGRLGPGALLLGPVAGPEHTLVGRPLEGCVLHRIELRELYRPEFHDEWAYHDPAWGRSPLEDAFARGVGRGLRVLVDAPLEGGAVGAVGPGPQPADDEILWMSVAPGSVQYGAAYSQEAAADLFLDAAMWQRMVDQQSRLLVTLDRWIDQVERAREDRTAAGIKAGEAVREQADRALLDSIGRPTGPGKPAPGGVTDLRHATLGACRLVAEAAGITLTAPPAGGTWGPDGAAAGDRLSPVEVIALASRLRTRPVKLTGRWWRDNVGPLLGHRAASGAPVALLWRRGGYDAVNPTSGRRSRITDANADEYEPRGVMLYRPLPEQPVSAWQLLRFSLHGTRPDLRTLILGGLVAVGLGTLVPIATGRVLGTYVPGAESGLIVQTCVAIIATTVVSTAFMLLQNIAVLRLEGRVEATLQPAVWDRLLRLPTRFFAGRSTGELAGAAMGISAIRRVLSGISTVAVQAGAVGTVNLVLLLWFSVPLALTALAMLAVIAVVFLGLGLAQLRWQRELIALGNKLNNQAFQTLRGLPKLRVAAAESFAYAAWAGEFARTRELQQRVGRMRNLSTVVNAVYLPVCTLVMFMLLAGPARGSLSASSFLTFTTAATAMLSSATQLTGALLSAAAVLPLFEQVRPILTEVPEVRGGSTVPGELTGAIEARNVSFRYTDDGPLVLDDVSFEVRPGEFVALVGASGCGKSTLLRMLIGFDEPVSGEVRYDGQDLAALDQAAVRRQCGVVLQNAQPFSGSMLDAICGAETFTLEQAWEAAELAGLAEDIRRMPMGMHTILADGGGAISGGQRQRLMIARALIRRPRILFFDEATSALDNETQRIVIDSTRKLSATRIVIAHRLSTITDADRVIVMAAGRIVQQGRPADLLADAGGLFHDLVQRQLR